MRSRRRSDRSPAFACSTIRRTRRTTDPCSPWRATLPAIKAAVLAMYDRGAAYHRSPHAPRRASATGRRGRRPVRPDRGRDDGACVALAKEVGAGGRRALRRSRLSLRGRRRTTRRARISKTSGAANSKGWRRKWRTAGWAPDFGPATPHVSAGASVIGARMPLIAYNINLNTDRLDVAKKIAAAIRHSSGGFRYVKAAGFELDGPRHRAGLDEPDELREDADFPRVRNGQARSRALRRARSSRARSSA